MDYLETMRISEAEAMLDDTYMSECYDNDLRAKNRGFLTLVSPEYFRFGTELVKVLCSKISTDTFLNLGDNNARIIKEEIRGNKQLEQEFLRVSAESFPYLPDDRKRKMYERLVEKSCNMKFNDVLKQYNDEWIGRRGKKRSDVAHRGNLKSRSEGSVVLQQNRVKQE